MSRWKIIFENIQQDIKLYLFVLGLLCILRIAFIAFLHTYLSPQSTFVDIAASLFYGLRLSLKSAGIIAVLSFFFCTLLSIILGSKRLSKLRFILGCSYISLLIVLFHARIPFYIEFHSAFNQMIFNTFHDDAKALLYTLVVDYELPVLLISALIISYICCYLLRRLLDTKNYTEPQFAQRYLKVAFRSVVISAVFMFILFARFGGSFIYAHSLHWENAAVTNDDFLNEAIIDDIQALYRAYSIQKRVSQGAGISINPEMIRNYGAYIKGSALTSNEVDDIFRKQAQGAKISKPKHIFIIIGESFAQWPLLDQYKSLHIADGVRGIIAKENAIHVAAFLPNGAFTPMAVTAVAGGLSDVGLYPNYHPESFKEPYSTAIAPQMEKLGYITKFWYGGASSWERIKDFVLAQGFDHFYGMGDFESKSGNVWGSDDSYLFNAVAASLEDEAPTLNVILTVSNHAPYTVNLAKEGFDESKVAAALPLEARGDKELLERLGHYWYTDRQIAEFVTRVQKEDSSSLFVITGDHADRTNISKTPTIFERYSVPLVLYGKGLSPQMISAKAAGSHINITPTLIELIAPAGFEYYSLGTSLTKGSSVGFSHNAWITPGYTGKLLSNSKETYPGSVAETLDAGAVQLTVDSMRALSWWRIERGKLIE